MKRIKRIAKINPEKKKKKEYEPSNTFKSADTSLKQSLKSAISDAVSDERAFGTFNSSLNAQYSDKATIDHPSEVSFSEIDFAGNSSPLSISQLEKRQWPSRIPNPDSAAVIKMKTFKTSRVPIIVTDAHDVSRLMVPAPNNNTRANTLVVPLSEDISSLQYDRSLGYRPSANSSNRSYFESNGASPH